MLFTTAGMHPLVPFLLGEPHPAGTRIELTSWLTKAVHANVSLAVGHAYGVGRVYVDGVDVAAASSQEKVDLCLARGESLRIEQFRGGLPRSVPVCLRKKRAKCDGSAKPRS